MATSDVQEEIRSDVSPLLHFQCPKCKCDLELNKTPEHKAKFDCCDCNATLSFDRETNEVVLLKPPVR